MTSATLDAEYVDVAKPDDMADEICSVGTRTTTSRRSPGTKARPAEWTAQAMRQLHAIEDLQPGWDSQGGERPDLSIVQSARDLLRALSVADDQLSKPRIDPTPGGGVQFTWESGPRYFEIELLDPRRAQFYFVDHGTNTECEGELHVGDSIGEVAQYACRAGTPT